MDKGRQVMPANPLVAIGGLASNKLHLTSQDVSRDATFFRGDRVMDSLSGNFLISNRQHSWNSFARPAIYRQSCSWHADGHSSEATQLLGKQSHNKLVITLSFQEVKKKDNKAIYYVRLMH